MNVLIVGSAGQDGRCLAKQCAERGWTVYGINRAGLHGPDGSQIQPCNIEVADEVTRAISAIKPARVFYVAAYHSSSETAEDDEAKTLRRSFAINVFGLLNFLDSSQKHNPNCRLFYAASSRIFGSPQTSPQNENTIMAPICPYGISKVAGMHVVRLYREQGLHAACGILYNHESPYRAPQFVTQRVARAVVEIERGERDELVLANLDATIDWGYAPEYADAMIRILDLDRGDDFVIASGKGRTVRDLVAAAFGYAGLSWERAVKIDQTRVIPSFTKAPIVGDSHKLFTATGWRPRSELSEIVRIMIDAERQRRKQS